MFYLIIQARVHRRPDRDVITSTESEHVSRVFLMDSSYIILNKFFFLTDSNSTEASRNSKSDRAVTK